MEKTQEKATIDINDWLNRKGLVLATHKPKV